MIILAIAVLILVYIVNRLLIVRRARSWSNDRAVPFYTTAFTPFSPLPVLLPSSILKYRLNTGWIHKCILYNGVSSKTVIFQPLLYGKRMIYSANLNLLRHVLSVGSPYRKPEVNSLKLLGINLISENGEIWKRHRRVIAPAFNHVTYRNVWDTTANVYKEMIEEEGWLDAEGGKELDINENTHKVALFLISMIGFGIPMSWSTPPFDEFGNRSMQSLFASVTANIFLRGESPKWIFKLGIKRLNDIDREYEAFEKCMVGLISERERKLKNMIDTEESDINSGGEYIKDILGRLVYSRISEGKTRLSDEEIMGNCFIFAFAGHETTANTLAATLAELALNLDKQEWLYSQIIRVIGDRPPTFDDYDNLDCVLACFYEALRLYPAAYAIVREPEKDEVVHLLPSEKMNGDLLIKKDDLIAFDFVGMLYDPEAYPDPCSFKPERWLSNENIEDKTSITRDMDAGQVSGNSPTNSLNGFIGFSIGPRTCIGHKFAKVEAVSILTHLIREWRVEPVKGFKERMQIGERNFCHLQISDFR